LVYSYRPSPPNEGENLGKLRGCLSYKVACNTLGEGFEDVFQYSSIGGKNSW